MGRYFTISYTQPSHARAEIGPFQVVEDFGQPGSEEELDDPVGLQIIITTDLSARM